MLVLEVIVLVVLLNLLFFLMSIKVDKNESMVSMYECGFDSVMSSRVGFSYRFFLISILFLVFDVEITLLIVSPYLEVGVIQVVGMWIFIFILLGGLLYEYFNGVLSWMVVENI